MLQRADVSAILAAEERRGRVSRLVLFALAAAVTVLLAAVGWIWWSAATRSPLADVSTEVVRKSDIHVTLVATGTLQAVHQVAVTGQTTGKVASVDATYNQHVAKGQPLAHLDLTALESRLTRASAMVDVQRANLVVATASLADAQANLKRLSAQTLGEQIAVKDLEQAQTAERRAEASRQMAAAQLDAAQADLSGAKEDVADGTIVSPMDGVVLDVAAEVGQWITAASLTQALFTVASDLRTLDLAVDIDEADVANVKEGDKVNFTVEAAPDTALSGTIRQVRSAPTVVDGVVSYKGMITVDNASMTLRPGMTATAVIDVADAFDVLTVPNSALLYSPGESIVSKVPAETLAGDHLWVLDQGTLRPLSVRLGLTDGQRTQIVSGLDEGDVVVTAGPK